MLRRKYPALLVWFLALTAGAFPVWAGGEEVVLLYAATSPESKSVADYYAAKRNVPTNQIIGLGVTVGDNISRADFARQVEFPLIDELQRRGLCRFETNLFPAMDGVPERIQYRCVESKIRYLVPTWGVPFRISEDPTFKERNSEGLAPQARRNEAAFDSELVVLAAKGHVSIYGVVPNVAAEMPNTSMHPTNGTFLVTRLDGPTPEIARGLVDKAIEAETNGLWGHAYFDERAIKEGAYMTGDTWITNAAVVARAIGFSTYTDHQPETIPDSFPLSQIALYAGWYEANICGPFANGTAEFMPGAIGYHLHSYSAVSIRSPTVAWVGPMLNQGVTATMGCVSEPYLHLTPQPHRLFERMLVRGFTFGEASIACQSVLSWMNVFVGDPLYRPGRDLSAVEAALQARNDPRQEWVILRKVNLYLEAGKPRGPLRRDLRELPLTTNSAVLSEKLAQIMVDDVDFKDAVEWGNRALALAKSPGQKLRLVLNLAQWNEVLGQPAAALATLSQAEALRPDYRDQTKFRQKQLNLAREAGLKSEVTRLLAELERLKPPPAKK